MGKITRILVLEMIILKCLLDIPVERLSRQTDTQVWDSEERSRLEIELQESSVYRWYLNPADSVELPTGE